MVFQKPFCGRFDNGSDAVALRRQRFAQQCFEMGSSATGFAYKKHHLFSHYGPYSDSRRRHARNWLRDNLPAGSYKVIINTKRAIFGPHEGPYED